MDEVTDALIHRMVRTIVAAVDPKQVILFGSRARGNPKSSSDVDFVVIQEDSGNTGRTRFQEEVRIYKALRGFRVPTDILVFGPDDVEYWKDSKNYVLARALREGRVLYERQQVCDRTS